MQNRPSKEELLRGVIRFLREEAVDKLEGRAKFHARVAGRAADMVLRELESEREELKAELKSLRSLLVTADTPNEDETDLATQVGRLNGELVKRIQAGEADDGPFREAALDHLKHMTVARLEVNNPKMAETVRGDFGFQ